MATGTIGAKSMAVALFCCLCLNQPAWGEESWQAAFNETCSKSGEAMNLSVDELRTLVDKAASLEKVIDKQEESLRKVYLKRLQMCRNLYAYVLEYKTGQAQK